MARKKTEKTEEKPAEAKAEHDKKPVKDDITCLKERVENLKSHLSKNKHDYKTKRTLQIKQSKLIKLQKFVAR